MSVILMLSRLLFQNFCQGPFPKIAGKIPEGIDYMGQVVVGNHEFES